MPRAPTCRGHVTALRWLDPIVLEVELRVVEPDELVFQAGQWIAIPLGEKTVRPYSMASPPSERRVIRLCVDVKPGGAGSRFFRQLKVGDEVRFQPPLGTLTVIRDSSAPLLLIGEEIGLVPFRSILLDEAERGVPRSMTLYAGADTRGHLLYGAEFRELAARHPRFRYRPVLRAPDPEWTGETGALLSVVERETGRLDGWEALLCGGGPLVTAARRLCLERGMERKKIRYEKFW